MDISEYEICYYLGMGEKNNKSSVLIIDDDPNFREIFSAKLKSEGFSVFEANGGENGLKKALEIIPDLILLDIEMPGMSGIKVLSEMKANLNLKHLKVVFLTNHGESGENDAWLDKKFANEIGATSYIRKTDDLDKIIKEVKNILES